RGAAAELISLTLVAHVRWGSDPTSLVVAEPESPSVQGLDHLVDRLLAEVRDRVQLRFSLGHKVTHGLDPSPLETVVGAHAQLELLDQDVVHRIRLANRTAARA